MNPAGTSTTGSANAACAPEVRPAAARTPPPHKAQYLALRKAGHSRREAATAPGVHYRTAGDWGRGTRRTGPGRMHADGRFVNNATGMTTYTDQTAEAHPLRLECLAQP